MVQAADEKKRKEIDDMLDRAADEATYDNVLRPGRRRAPAWYRGGRGAAASSIEAARAMGFNVPTPEELRQ
jgi:hypothetical protein